MADNKKMAMEILDAVGGPDNITSVAHCMTRLRFILKDSSIPDEATVKKINGVLGTAVAGGQFQVIIGPSVAKVYAEVCNIGGVKSQKTIQENLDAPKEKKKRTPMGVINDIVGAMAACLTPLIPLLLCCGMCKMLVAVLGPQLLGLISQEGNLYILLTFVGDAGFYFLPVIIGYTAANRFGLTPIMGMLLGAILVHPTLVGMAGTTFTVYGIPAAVQTYSSTMFPIFLTVWLAAYVEKFFRKHVPDVLQVIGVPLLTLLVMLPVELCVCGPIGAYLGNGIAAGLIKLNEVAGPLSVAVLGGTWTLLVLCGMHMAMLPFLMQSFSSLGCDTFIIPGMFAGSWATFGCMLAVLLLVKNREKRGIYTGYVIAWLIGGVGEPYKYGVQIPYRTPLYASVVSGFLTGLVAGFLHLTAYVMSTQNGIYFFAAFFGGSQFNYIALAATAVAGTIIGFITMWLFKIDESLVP